MIADKLLNKLEKDIKYTKFNNLSTYIKFVDIVSLAGFFLSLILISLVMYFLYNYYDWVLFILALIFSLIIYSLLLFYFYLYPKLSKSDFIRELESEYPLFLLYLYGLVSSGVPLPEAFEIIIQRKREFPRISKEISYTLKISKFLGMDFISSLIYLANNTESRKLKEFLYEIISASRSGGDIDIVIERLYRDSIKEYELSLRQFIEKMDYVLTIYVFVFVVFPIILLVLSLLFSIASGTNTLLKDLSYFIIVFIPFAYIIFLYLLYLLQPRV